jgi:hypothetical protein
MEECQNWRMIVSRSGEVWWDQKRHIEEYHLANLSSAKSCRPGLATRLVVALALQQAHPKGEERVMLLLRVPNHHDPPVNENGSIGSGVDKTMAENRKGETGYNGDKGCQLSAGESIDSSGEEAVITMAKIETLSSSMGCLHLDFEIHSPKAFEFGKVSS